MTYNVFDTEIEADNAQVLDYNSWIAVHTEPQYVSETSDWDIPKQRLTDGKWVYELCPTGNQTYLQEEYVPAWFYEEA